MGSSLLVWEPPLLFKEWGGEGRGGSTPQRGIEPPLLEPPLTTVGEVLGILGEGCPRGGWSTLHSAVSWEFAPLASPGMPLIMAFFLQYLSLSVQASGRCRVEA